MFFLICYHLSAKQHKYVTNVKFMYYFFKPNTNAVTKYSTAKSIV